MKVVFFRKPRVNVKLLVCYKQYFQFVPDIPVEIISHQKSCLSPIIILLIAEFCLYIWKLEWRNHTRQLSREVLYFCKCSLQVTIICLGQRVILSKELIAEFNRNDQICKWAWEWVKRNVVGWSKPYKWCSRLQMLGPEELNMRKCPSQPFP